MRRPAATHPTASPAAGPAHAHRRARWGVAGLIALVVLLHAWVTQSVMAHLRDLSGDGDTVIERMEADLVADMELTEPPVAVAPPPPPVVSEPVAPPEPAPVASAASRPEPKASAPQQPASAPEQAASSATQLASGLPNPDPERLPPAEPAASAASAASAPSAVASAASTPSGPAFEWPQATRVTYKVEGYLRGPIYGSALVEWVRQDLRYQVHVDASLGPSFAPLAARRWTSEGVITPQGLAPRTFESVDRLLIRTSAPKVVRFEEKELLMPSGERIPKLPDVQDPASHYIHLAYQFILNPERLKVGGVVELPMAHTRKQEEVTYDVEAREELQTPLGMLDTYRLKPRKLKDQKLDILAEIWLAPGLQYLPVRMLLRQGENNFLDMQMDRKPLQTAARPLPDKAADNGNKNAPGDTQPGSETRPSGTPPSDNPLPFDN